jgi:glycosyltransferase involved in cell wall biosynthesis
LSDSTPPDDTRILVDLKPALDGYAGIPQETRLLFSGLKALPGNRVTGLIQHGGRLLRPALTPRFARKTAARQILQLSKFIVSMTERPYAGGWEQWGDNVAHFASRHLLKLRTQLGLPVTPSLFDGRIFPDFVWRTFFDKTLPTREMERVANDAFRVLHNPRKQFHQVGLDSIVAERARYPFIDTRGFDYFVAQTPFPGRISPGTRMVVRYHDAVPILMPHTISDKAFHQATHYHALRSNLASGALFSCVSNATRQDLLSIFPEAEPLSFVIHNMVSDAFFEEQVPRQIVSRVVRNRMPPPEGKVREELRVPDEFDYLLMVATIEPRKNHLQLIRAWEHLKYASFPDLKLVLVGSDGWDAATLSAVRKYAQRGDMYHLQNVPSGELRTLYSHAKATVCPSFAEGFDFSGVEAMRCGCPVVASDIPVHREVYRTAALYFNPYDQEDAVAKIEAALQPGATALRQQLVEDGRQVGRHYTPSVILPQWADFLARHQPSLQMQEAALRLR